MSNNEFIFGNQFSDYIRNMIPGSRIVSGGKEIVCRCRYCPDSRDINHGHMYIKIPQSSDDPILFYCFKCHTAGILDSRTMLEWGIYDPSIGIQADKINNLAAKHNKTIGYHKEWYPFNNIIIDHDLAKIKLDYLNNRLGTSLDFRDCVNNKIILNLKDSLDSNNISRYSGGVHYTRHPNIINQLNQYFIGFLSLDNNFVNMRRICDEGIVYESIDKRYINYNIFGKKDNTEKMYILPTTIDLTLPKRVNIHIAEGPFDILSIKFNLRKFEDGIFAAVTGSGYKGLLMHIISSFKIFFFDLHVYPDNDRFGDKTMIEDLLRLVRPYGATLYEHRNVFSGEKDFGVSLSHIDERIIIHK